MENESGESEDLVSVSMELSGEYGEVMSKLRTERDRIEGIDTLAEDLGLVLETVDRIGGGTKSAVASELPGDLSETYDAEAVVDALQVLERYGLVELEGNTWKPGPAL